MIKIIYGPKGFGKTKIILDELNTAAETAKGNVVFVTDKCIASTANIDLRVRLAYTEEHNVNGAVALGGFINGLLAGNSDIEYVFIDGLKRIIGNELEGGEKLFDIKGDLQKEYPDLKFLSTVRSTLDEHPPSMKNRLD